MSEPRFLVRRDKDIVLIALNTDLTNYARRLATKPIASLRKIHCSRRSRVIERLREVSAPAGVSIPDARLVRMAAEVPEHAAVSSRQELYPCWMQGRPRTQARRKGAPLWAADAHCRTNPRSRQWPLSGSCTAARSPWHWRNYCVRPGLTSNDSSGDGVGCYVSLLRDLISVTSGSHSILRQPTRPGQGEAGEVTPGVKPMPGSSRNGCRDPSRKARSWHCW
ncbi:MAG: hypothetical protein R3C02_07800 [Planctomycetaceae bacterium]